MKAEEMDAAKALTLTRAVSERYNCRDIFFVDNIMPRNYPNTFFRRLADSGDDLRIFYEVKSNITVDDLRLMALGGLQQLQPGIESLSTEVLKLMKKGVTAVQNIYILKWCRYFGVDVSWNLLWGLPGESNGAYEAQVKLLPWLSHLMPPGSVPETVVQRFSPMHRFPEKFGIKGVKPARVFRELFPDFEDEHENLSYFFDHEGCVGVDISVALAVARAVETWRTEFRAGARLEYSRIPGRKLEVVDLRCSRIRKRVVFAYPASLVYELCSIRWHSVESLAREIKASGVDCLYSTSDLECLLAGFLSSGLVFEDGGVYLSLAVPSSKDYWLYDGATCYHKLKSAYRGDNVHLLGGTVSYTEPALAKDLA